MEISELKTVDDALMDAMRRLLRQLNPKAVLPDKKALEKIVHSDSTHLFMVRDGSQWTGSLSLVIYDIPTGRQARIEDVVVDKKYRGRGLGRALMEEAIGLARKKNAKAVSLTSRPSRKAANQMYLNMGFELHETNVYILGL